MGRKHLKARKHILFLVAGLILLFLGGCATSEKVRERTKSENSPPEEKTFSLEEGVAAEAKERDDLARTYLLNGKRLFIEGDYEGSLREYQKVVALLKRRPPADEAVFNMGLIQAYLGNPRKDFDKSIDFMKRVIKEYPQSPFVPQANIWIGILQANEKLAKENEKLIKDQEKLAKENERLAKDHEKLVKENEKLIKMLEEYKRVDIEIEEKKREKGR